MMRHHSMMQNRQKEEGPMNKLASVITFACLIMIPLKGAHAQCLARNNDRVSLRHTQVYSNGKLSFQLDGWDWDDTIYKGALTVYVRSNDRAFNRIVEPQPSYPGANKRDDQFNIGDDGTLCPGIHVQAACELSGSVWDCLFTEYRIAAPVRRRVDRCGNPIDAYGQTEYACDR
jgi:hypothetical protein